MNIQKFLNKFKIHGLPLYCTLLMMFFALGKYLSAPPAGPHLPRHVRVFVRFGEGHELASPLLAPGDLARVRSAVAAANRARLVRNVERYGPVRADTDTLLVRVHRDAERLQYLLASLAQLDYVQNTLVVFSHSFYDDSINKMIMSITFCRVMQIFYPLSVQLNPNKFPGLDPGDCLHSRNSRKHCSRRDARLAEAKHHWWWQANFVFNHLEWSPDYKGTVIFLEEDNYVLPDLLYMVRYAKRSQSIIPGTNVMAFGRPYGKGLDYSVLIVDTWRPAYDVGLAFNKTVWQKISALTYHFCTYDDISWDLSLLKVFSKFPEGHCDMVACMAPRVLSTSVYASGKDAFDNIYWNIQGVSFFPGKVKAAMVYSNTGRVDSGLSLPVRGNGGWSDIRDHMLCMNPFSFRKPTQSGRQPVKAMGPRMP